MILNAYNDDYGNVERLTADELRHILDLIDEYMNGIPYVLCEIRRDNINDLHGRIDVAVRYINEKNHIVEQKLLILDDAIIDGKTFHKRFSEWYGN